MLSTKCVKSQYCPQTKQKREKISATPGFAPRATGWEARILPLCYAKPAPTLWLSGNEQHFHLQLFKIMYSKPSYFIRKLGKLKNFGWDKGIFFCVRWKWILLAAKQHCWRLWQQWRQWRQRWQQRRRRQRHLRQQWRQSRQRRLRHKLFFPMNFHASLLRWNWGNNDHQPGLLFLLFNYLQIVVSLSWWLMWVPCLSLQCCFPLSSLDYLPFWTFNLIITLNMFLLFVPGFSEELLAKSKCLH